MTPERGRGGAVVWARLLSVIPVLLVGAGTPPWRWSGLRRATLLGWRRGGGREDGGQHIPRLKAERNGEFEAGLPRDAVHGLAREKGHGEGLRECACRQFLNHPAGLL